MRPIMATMYAPLAGRILERLTFALRVPSPMGEHEVGSGSGEGEPGFRQRSTHGDKNRGFDLDQAIAEDRLSNEKVRSIASGDLSNGGDVRGGLRGERHVHAG